MQTIDNYSNDILAHLKNIDIEYIKKIETKKIDINIQDEFGKTALHYAVEKSDIRLIEKLIALGTNIQITDSKGLTPVSIAFKNNDTKIIEYFLNDKNIALPSKEGYLPIFTLYDYLYATENPDIKYIKVFIDSIGIKNDNDNSILAIDKLYKIENLPVMEFILDVIYKDEEMKKFLDEADSEDNLPVFLACDENNIPILKSLIENGVDINIRGGKHNSSLLLYALDNDLDIVDYIINMQGLDINAQDNFGETALHVACYDGYVDIVKKLIAMGAKVNLQDTIGNTVINSHSFGEDIPNDIKEILKTVLDTANKIINIQNENGHTPLMNLCFRAFETKETKFTLELLLEYLPNPFIKDSRGLTALDLAKNNCKLNLNNIGKKEWDEIFSMLEHYMDKYEEKKLNKTIYSSANEDFHGFGF